MSEAGLPSAFLPWLQTSIFAFVAKSAVSALLYNRRKSGHLA
jgi:hypothetical protein